MGENSWRQNPYTLSFVVEVKRKDCLAIERHRPIPADKCQPGWAEPIPMSGKDPVPGRSLEHKNHRAKINRQAED
jgi:hypothetical protein